MLKFVKKILLVLLIVCPTVFYGQSKKGIFPTRSKKSNASVYTFKKPVEKIRYDSKYSYPYVNADFGPAFLNADNYKSKWGYEGHVGIGYEFINIFGIEANIGFSSLDGKYQQLELLSLNCWELDLNFSVNLTNLVLGYNAERRINVEPHIGVGQIQYKGHILYNDGKHFFVGHDNDASNNMLGKGVHGRMIALTVPYGIDINYEITKKLKVHIDVSTCFIDSDCLDGVERGLHYDWYSHVRVGISYAWSRYGHGHKKIYSPCDFNF